MDKNNKTAIFKWIILFLTIIVIVNIPAPEGLDKSVMKILAIYGASILGLIIRPAGESVVLIVIAGLGSLMVKPSVVLGGFSTTTVWLVFVAFLISMAFVKTGIGARIAYLLIGVFGRTTLGLCYVMAIVDAVISPATPSNTARSGGITYPIFKSIAHTLGSDPGPDGRKIGALFTMLQGLVSYTTAALFITACAPNSVTVGLASSILGVEITWAGWAVAMAVPTVILLLILPVLIYRLYPPELKNIPDAKEISQKGLQELGPLKNSEKILMALFVLSILGWAFGPQLGLDATCVAMAFLAFALLFHLFEIKDVLENKSAWNTLLWFGFICGLSASLANAGFFVWLAEQVQKTMNLAALGMIPALALIIAVCLGIRYLFASMGAYVTSFVPVAFTIGMVAGVPPYVLVYMVGACTAYGCGLTHYGGALGPVLYGTGYVKQNDWWRLGFIYAMTSVLIYFAAGLPYWKLLGLW